MSALYFTHTSNATNLGLALPSLLDDIQHRMDMWGKQGTIDPFKEINTVQLFVPCLLQKVTPTYHLLTAEGPDHAKTFTVEVRVAELPLATAIGSSKKDAEQNAARRALDDLIPASPARPLPRVTEVGHV